MQLDPTPDWGSEIASLVAQIAAATAASRTALATTLQAELDGRVAALITDPGAAYAPGADAVLVRRWATGGIYRLTPGELATVLAGVVSVKTYGATGDGATDDTAAINLALAAVPAAGGVLYFPAGTYITTGLSVRRNNIAIVGAGAGVSILKMKASAAEQGIVLELGDTASGNSATAYSNIHVRDLATDGNRSGTTQPTVDTLGYGIIATKISKGSFHNLRCLNNWTAGFIIVIDSNYNVGSNIYCENNGHSNGGLSSGFPNFDVNSSKYCNFANVVTKDGQYGARLLDNVFGFHLDITVQNAAVSGLVLGNQSVNRSSGNVVRVSVKDGCTSSGVQIGSNVTSCVIDATVEAVTGYGFQIADGGNASKDNRIRLLTRAGQTSSLVITSGTRNVIDLVANGDCLGGSAGDNFFVTVAGDANVLDIVIDDPTTHGRGVQIASGTGNRIRTFKVNNSVQEYSDGGTNTEFCWTAGVGADIASAASITIPRVGSAFAVTGTTNITGGINGGGAGHAGHVVTLIFAGILTVSDEGGGNLHLNGNLTTAAKTTLTLISNGTDWYEVARAAD